MSGRSRRGKMHECKFLKAQIIFAHRRNSDNEREITGGKIPSFWVGQVDQVGAIVRNPVRAAVEEDEDFSAMVK